MGPCCNAANNEAESRGRAELNENANKIVLMRKEKSANF